MAHDHHPYDLVKHALASLSLEDKLSSFEGNEVDDDSIIKALSKPETLTALPTVLGHCIAIGKTTAFIDEFQKAIQRRKEVRLSRSSCSSGHKRAAHLETDCPQDEESQRRVEEQRIAAEKARIVAIESELPVLRLAIALTQV